MRTLLKLVSFLAATVVLALAAGFCWVYFYSRDLPDTGALAKYAPSTVTQVSDACLGPSTAVPYEAIGATVRNAISAVETSESDPSVLRVLWIDRFEKGGYFGIEGSRRRTLNASIYIARSLCYVPSTQSRRTLAELRTAVQLEHHYSRRKLFTVFANRAYFGRNLIGVNDASEFYFHRAPAELDLPETALLIGMIYSPTMYSPLKHPDRALFRRNQIIDTMLIDGSITSAEAQAAKTSPLPIVPAANTTELR